MPLLLDKRQPDIIFSDEPAGLVIYNILKIAVSQRIKQYGILRAIGGEKGQLYYLVTAQVLLLCVIGILIGLLLGGLSAKGILTAATGFLSPEIFLVQDSAELNRLMEENSSVKWVFLSTGNSDPAVLYCKNEHRRVN